ncbi:triacylglycerol lipase [Dorcoceras hygrometricum]|uniref:Triacylglycerol lipase n=1 Tax=Dorcoceras hygrometricum TaxID=472368 RepID=A0A2Z7AJN0_9LAMI|nr:triacylglycerol lipase [Dorcoceras hygrometricum]
MFTLPAELKDASADLLFCGRLAPTSFTTKPALQTDTASRGPTTIVAPKSQFGLAQRIMVKHLATSPHDPLGITDSACNNHLVVVSIQYGPFNTYIPIRSTTIGKSRVARDPIAMNTSRRSNSDITSVTRVSMKFRVVRTNQYNQDLGLFHSTNGNHLKSPNEGSSIDHQVTIHLHAQNITMFPTNEHGTCLEYTVTIRWNEGSSIDHQVTIHLHAQNITMFPTNEHGFPGYSAGRGGEPAGDCPRVAVYEFSSCCVRFCLVCVAVMILRYVLILLVLFRGRNIVKWGRNVRTEG